MTETICEMCGKNTCIPNLEDVKLNSFCEECFKGTEYLKHFWILKFINENAPKFLEYYYYTHYTKASESEKYFRQFGGNNWNEKYKLSKHYKYYQECLLSSEYKETLKKLIVNSYNDLEQIIYNDEKNGVYKIEEYLDIYYSFEQFEFILRQINWI